MTASILLYWHLEKTWTIQNLSTVVEPTKNYGEIYELGEDVQARFKGTTYPATVIHISRDRDELTNAAMELSKVLESNLDITSDEVIGHMRLVLHISGSTNQQKKKVGKDIQKKKVSKKTKSKEQEDSDQSDYDSGSNSPPKKKPRKDLKKKISKKNNSKEQEDSDQYEFVPEMMDVVMKKKAEMILQRKRARSPTAASENDELSEQDENLQMPVLQPLKTARVVQQNKKMTTLTSPARITPLASPVRVIQNELVNITPIERPSRFDNSDITYEAESDIGKVEEHLSRLEKKMKNELRGMRERLNSVEDELQSLRKKYKRIKKKKYQCTEQEDEIKLYNDLTLSNLKKVILNEMDGSKMASKLLLAAFDSDYIVSHSLTGQKANKDSIARPAMHGPTVTAIKNILHEKLGESFSTVHGRLQNVQRVLRAKDKQLKV